MTARDPVCPTLNSTALPRVHTLARAFAQRTRKRSSHAWPCAASPPLRPCPASPPLPPSILLLLLPPPSPPPSPCPTHECSPRLSLLCITLVLLVVDHWLNARPTNGTARGGRRGGGRGKAGKDRALPLDKAARSASPSAHRAAVGGAGIKDKLT
jgi:hypothetical protein